MTIFWNDAFVERTDKSFKVTMEDDAVIFVQTEMVEELANELEYYDSELVAVLLASIEATRQPKCRRFDEDKIRWALKKILQSEYCSLEELISMVSAMTHKEIKEIFESDNPLKALTDRY